MHLKINLNISVFHAEHFLSKHIDTNLTVPLSSQLGFYDSEK